MTTTTTTRADDMFAAFEATPYEEVVSTRTHLAFCREAECGLFLLDDEEDICSECASGRTQTLRSWLEKA